MVTDSTCSYVCQCVHPIQLVRDTATQAIYSQLRATTSHQGAVSYTINIPLLIIRARTLNSLLKICKFTKQKVSEDDSSDDILPILCVMCVSGVMSECVWSRVSESMVIPRDGFFYPGPTPGGNMSACLAASQQVSHTVCRDALHLKEQFPPKYEDSVIISSHWWKVRWSFVVHTYN